MADEDDDEFGAFGGGQEEDTFDAPTFTANAMQGSGRRTSIVSSSISLARGTGMDASSTADLIATGTT
jgi:hypothetical protein